jgi:hypothetical protein
MWLIVVLAIAVLVFGTGWITDTARFVVGYVTGNEHGTELFRGSVSQNAGGLTLTVTRVTRTRHFTRVNVVSRNHSGATMTIHRGGLCQFTGEDGTKLSADTYRGQWSDELAPGTKQRGAVVFEGHLPRSVRRASLSFTSIYGGPDSITVRGIRLKSSR